MNETKEITFTAEYCPGDVVKVKGTSMKGVVTGYVVKNEGDVEYMVFSPSFDKTITMSHPGDILEIVND